MDKGQVLIVDDEQDILSSLEGILEDEGYRVAKADSGERALEMMRAEAPDVVLVDVWMPGIDGIKTLQAAKEFQSDTEVIVMSGHGNIDTAVKATKLGAFDFIEKPLSMEAVIRVVNKAVRKKRIVEVESADSWGVSLEGNDPGVVEVRKQIAEAVADLRPVVICGEPGAGKRFVARKIHLGGITKGAAFQLLHCRTLPEKGDEAALADSLRRLFPDDTEGTLFLGGLEHMEAAKRFVFLDALLANTKQRKRVVVAIDEESGGENRRELASEVAEYLLARRIYLPSLRDRREDILPLAKRFLEEASKKMGLKKEFEVDAMAALFQFNWSGNVVELKGAVNQALSSAPGKMIRAEHLPRPVRGGYTQELDEDCPANFKAARRDWERRFFSYHLVRNNWDIKDTARSVGVPLATLKRKLQTHRLESPSAGQAPREGVQKTIGRSVVMYGHGLHSGIKTGLLLEPLPPGSGIHFGNLTTSETVAARVAYVESTDHATNLRDGSVVARTIEHLMSALHAYGLTNLLVKIGEEVPIMEGSAMDFCQLIEDAGIEEQDAGVPPLIVDKVYEAGKPGGEEGFLRIEPSGGFTVSFRIEHPPPIGTQSYTYAHSGPESYKTEIATARTFGFIWELEKLEQQGLAEGGRWGNVILVDRERVVNTELRFPDEFVRHKILDLIGDLYLLGRPILGKVTAERTGHRHNVALVKLLSEAML